MKKGVQHFQYVQKKLDLVNKKIRENLVFIRIIKIFGRKERQFTRPLNDLANQFNTMLSAIAGADRVYDILDEDGEDASKTEINRLSSQENVRGEIQFQNVTFAYEAGDNTIIDVSFHVKSGETIALVGPTGAGKTTIINLLTRFYDPNHGMILLDGTNISMIEKERFREYIGFVPQEVFIFEGTVKENILYGQLNASDDEVIEAAKRANAHTVIMKLPQGYDTKLGQDGSSISQGQKQLLSIARAILRNPKILILDEATSNIDTVTEIEIQEALKQLMKGRTTFVIAHRLNTIQQADEIIVLKEGRIVEKGTHLSLLEKKGNYCRMYGRGLLIES